MEQSITLNIIPNIRIQTLAKLNTILNSILEDKNYKNHSFKK